MTELINIKETFDKEITLLTEQLSLMVEISENWEDSVANLVKVQECMEKQDNIKQLTLLIKITSFHQINKMSNA